MEEICGAPGQASIRRTDRAAGSLRFARAARYRLAGDLPYEHDRCQSCKRL